MTRSLPPLSWMRTFEAAARHLSFTAAANELGLTPAAVSQHVRHLEAWIAAPLFLRQRGGLALTDAGRALGPSVAGALDGLRAGVTAVVADGRGRRTLTLRAPVAFAALWLAPRLGAFEAAHPDIDLRLQTEVWPGDGELGAVDAEIRHGAGRWPGAVAQRLSRDRLTLAVHPDHARADPLATIEAAGGLITVVGYSSGWPAWFAALDLTPPTLTAWPVDSELVAAAAAEAGRGAVLARLPLYTRLIDTGRLVTPFADSAVEEGFFLLADPDRLRSSVGDDFAGWLRAAFSEPGASTAVAVGRTDPETGR